MSIQFNGSYGTMYYVQDMDKAVRFYKEAFGLTPSSESPGWTTFSFNGHELCLHLADAKSNTGPGGGMLILQVKDLKNTVSTLKTRGVEFAQDIKEVCEGGYSADFRDPSGNIVSLFEYLGKE